MIEERRYIKCMREGMDVEEIIRQHSTTHAHTYVEAESDEDV